MTSQDIIISLHHKGCDVVGMQTVRLDKSYMPVTLDFIQGACYDYHRRMMEARELLGWKLVSDCDDRALKFMLDARDCYAANFYGPDALDVEGYYETCAVGVHIYQPASGGDRHMPNLLALEGCELVVYEPQVNKVLDMSDAEWRSISDLVI